MKSLHLKPGREKPLLRRHPWIFSGSIAHLKGDPVSGETVEVYDSGGNFLARAAYSPKSQIRGRVWTWDRGQQVDRDFIHALIKKAIAYRETIQKLNAVNNNAPHLAESKSIDQKSKALRLIHAESDGLPGLIVDAYNDILISQALSAGVEHWLDDIVEILVEVSQAKCICERSDVDVRKLEGLPSRIRILKGAEPPKRLIIDESGLRFYVDWQFGHKTGFYIDQRTNRRIIRK
ncbi:MAG: 23S rRNA (cytosine(1962)-C(5))-methyltransferase RlmI, partial [Anaerolineales bacterium]